MFCENFLYGTLNEKVTKNTYHGKDTDTISLNVDNADNIISANTINAIHYFIADSVPQPSEQYMMKICVLKRQHKTDLFICVPVDDSYEWVPMTFNNNILGKFILGMSKLG